MACHGLNDDYAVLETRDARFYYGYEVTVGGDDDDDDETGEWCFQATINGKVVATIPESQLSKKSLGEPVEYLLTGIGLMLDKFNLVERQ